MESIVILVAVAVGLFLVSRAAGNPLHHSLRFRLRRLANWLPLGLTYSFFYMGRYNLTVAKNALGLRMSKEDFGIIFGAGTITYAFSFLTNGPITDRIGGKRAILIGAYGSALMNGLLGYLTYLVMTRPDSQLNIVNYFSLLYALNMYFQNYGAAAIVKVNSNWFHVRERGSFSGIFGTLISLGIFFAFDWGSAIVQATAVSPAAALGPFQQLWRHVLVPEDPVVDQVWWVFILPAILLLLFATYDLFFLRDQPSQAGLEDFDTADASSGEEDQPFVLAALLKKILTNKVILTIAAIEFCSGVLRNGIMHWYTIYAKEIQLPAEFLFRQHWGAILAIAGISGGMMAGFLSDKVFGSRRGPVAALLYGSMIISTVIMIFALKADYLLGGTVALLSLAVIGVHGMLSGTATMDFGGRKAAGTAVGVIDSFVYLGTGVQSLALGFITTRSWAYWPIFLLPFAVIGFVLSIKIWRAFPGPAKTRAGH